MTFGELFKRVYIRPPEAIPPEHRSLLLLVGAAYFIAGYDVNIYGFAAKQIQQSFAIPESDIGLVIAIFRLGVIPALGLAYLADRIGRRNLLMLTLAGAAVATVWTAFAQSLEEFIAAGRWYKRMDQTHERSCEPQKGIAGNAHSHQQVGKPDAIGRRPRQARLGRAL